MAGNENVAANYSDMGATATQFNNKYAEFEQALAQISAAIEQVGATWQGAGFASFQTVSMEWHAQVTSLNTTLSEISKNVNRSSNTYSETDHGVAQSFNGFGR